jgi:hypothetical protein
MLAELKRTVTPAAVETLLSPSLQEVMVRILTLIESACA